MIMTCLTLSKMSFFRLCVKVEIAKVQPSTFVLIYWCVRNFPLGTFFKIAKHKSTKKSHKNYFAFMLNLSFMLRRKLFKLCPPSSKWFIQSLDYFFWANSTMLVCSLLTLTSKITFCVAKSAMCVGSNKKRGRELNLVVVIYAGS